ncbi:rRNA maturation RNase YbeY [Fortiea contorta]|uniref:rRNA maturation RNase YbeY n=1 Tax=Fortiea contorta TaxID=1892405 RepID=UPI000349734E|nr:rRNA maturation RNase YbeY [Fortiea contorta]
MLVELDVQNYFDELSPKASINFGDDSAPLTTETWENWFNQWLQILEDDLPTASGYEIGLRLTNDAEIETLNAQFRHQNRPTDVLSFPALEVDFPENQELLNSEPLYLGDIVISVDTAQRQAQQQQHNLSTELAWLAAHGLLHLLGWDHPDEESLMHMLIQQVILLKAISITIDIE